MRQEGGKFSCYAAGIRKSRPWCDVTSLYPSVPIDKMISLLFDIVNNDNQLKNKTPFTSGEIRHVMNIVLNHGNYFVCQGQFYQMNNMGPIGNAFMTVGAECYLQYIESLALNPMTLSLNGFDICNFEFWVHYVDDVLDSVNQDFNVEAFLNYLNSFDARIQFTVETQEGNEFSFLDIKLTMNSDGTISTSVFRKVSHLAPPSKYPRIANSATSPLASEFGTQLANSGKPPPLRSLQIFISQRRQNS